MKNSSNKHTINDNVITINSRHSEINNYFRTEEKKIEDYIKQRNKFKKRIEQLDVKSDFTYSDAREKSQLLDKIEDFNLKIKKIEDKDDEINYIFNSGQILRDYYNNNQKVENVRKNDEKISIKDFFNKNKGIKNNDKQSKLLSSYQQINDNKPILKKTQNGYMCKKCNVDNVLTPSESCYTCPKCGIVNEIIFENDRVRTKDMNNGSETNTYPYKRINHFQEWLNNIMGRESTIIDNKIYTDIINELNKTNITDLKSITREDIRLILKKLGYNKFYEHIPHILNKISGITPPQISKEVEDKLILMFKLIQKPFEKYKPPERKNFLSYSYVFHKLCELLELDHLLEYFPLLKNRHKLRAQDLIWEKICEDLNWQFYPSC